MSSSPDVLPLRQRKPLRISTDIPLFGRCSSDSSSSSSSPANQNITPGTTPSTGIPQCFFQVLCMHDFESSDPVQLPFHKGEVLTIIKQEHSGWWAAMRPQEDRIGWIPSSFVLPVDRTRIVEHPDEPETLASWPYESLNDPPLSAVHNPWVPVSEDYTALSFRLVTPTDLVLYKGFFDDRLGARNHNHEPRFSPPHDEPFFDMEDVCVPPTPGSPPPHRIQRPNPLPSELGELQLNRPASLPLLDAALHHHPHPCRIDDKTSLLCLTTPVSSDEITPQLIPSLDNENSLVVLKSVSTSHDPTYSDDGINGQSQRSRSPMDFRPAGAVQGIPEIKSLDLTIWGPDDLAEQLCVLMHTLYAAIRQNDCLEWMMGCRSTDVTGLRHFFDIHDYIASWVQKSILAYDDMTRHETLNFWIRVAEKCHTLRNFDSLCGIILALSESSLSSLGSAWARCAHKQIFVSLRNMLDVTDKSDSFMDIMDAAKGPSVPFVRGYMDHIKEHRVGHSNKRPHQSGHATDAGSSAALWKMQLAAVSTLLRHQSSPYDFKITKSMRSLIDDELQTVRLANDGWQGARTFGSGNSLDS